MTFMVIALWLPSSAQDNRFLPDEGNLIVRESYVLKWNSRLRIPDLIAYEVTASELNNVNCDGARYHTDPKLFSYSTSDYEGAFDEGFEKGHLVPISHGSWSETACLHTSYYSNILPMSTELNHGAWRWSELRAESLVKDYGSVYVHAGPLPFSLYRLPSGMPIPIGFWKLLIYEVDGVWTKECYMFPQYSDANTDVFQRYEEIDGTGVVNGRSAYLDMNVALQNAERWGCEGYDTFRFENEVWFLPCKNGELTQDQKLRSFSCDENLIFHLLNGVKIIPFDLELEHETKNGEREEMMVEHFAWCLQNGASLFPLDELKLSLANTELANFQLVNALIRASWGCGEKGHQVNREIPLQLVEEVHEAFDAFRIRATSISNH